MGSILAIDYGLKRIGFAVSDPSRSFAFPYGVFENTNIDGVIKHIKEIIIEKEIDLIVIGLPYNMPSISKKKSKMTNIVEGFIKRLQNEIKLPVKIVDERLSSFTAQENLKESGLSLKESKKHVDEEAARILLQEFIESTKKL